MVSSPLLVDDDASPQKRQTAVPTPGDEPLEKRPKKRQQKLCRN
jgi:hypothetical protein